MERLRHNAQAKMHPGEFDIDEALVRRLLSEQMPRLAEMPIHIVRSTGTVNAIFRLGEAFYARLPRLAGWAESLENEWAWLPKFAPKISLRIPQPAALGRPTPYYPCAWAVYEWLDGSPYQEEFIRDERQAAEDLAQFILELRAFDPAGAPRGGRPPLAELDAETRAAMDAAGDAIDVDAVLAIWSRSLEAPAWDGKPVWIHGDLLKSNLLIKDGRLRAVIDFGGVGIGDPAADVVPAWSVFRHSGRERFRQALSVDEATWDRARGYALHQALMILPYYPITNPEFVWMAMETIAEITEELAYERNLMDRTTWLTALRRDCEEKYDQYADTYYNAENTLASNPTHQRFTQEFLDLFPGGGMVLDAACGAGRYLPDLLEKRHTVIAIDQSQGMLRRAQGKFPGVQFEKTGLQEMDYQGVFDGAICMDAMENVTPEDWLPVLRNFQRALKPGGYLYFTAETLENADENEIRQAFEKAQADRLPVVYGEWPDEEVYHYHPSNQQVRDWVEQAGFEILKAENGEIWYYHVVARKI